MKLSRREHDKQKEGSMKKIAVLIVLVLLLIPCLVLANSGGTDKWGGHTPSDGSGYHYHNPPTTPPPGPNPNNPYNPYNPNPRK